jgi:predicted ester cyclase
MRIRIIALSTTVAFAFSLGIPRCLPAQMALTMPEHAAHHYSPYEQLIYRNASTFHKNFDNHEFEKNKALVIDDLHVNSNGTEFRGADEFVKRIARFVGPFPDVKITDLYTVVDGNMAAIRFVITGTHEGDFTAPDGVIHATHKKIKVDGVEYFTFNKDGKLTDLLTVEDLVGLIRQLKN